MKKYLYITLTSALVVFFASLSMGASFTPTVTAPSGARTVASAITQQNPSPIAMGDFGGVAICGNGTLNSWGWDGSVGFGQSFGFLGDDGTVANQTTPVTVSGLTGITAISTQRLHTLALKSDGTVWSWGKDYYGELGDGGTNLDKATPVQVSGLTGIIAIAAGGNHSLALKSDGTVWSWGHNSNGQLGDGTTTDRGAPVAVAGGLTGVVAIAAGYHHSIAVKSDGTVRAWGINQYGNLGDGTTTQRNSPVTVTGLTGITSAGARTELSFFLKNDGTVWGCGQAWNGSYIGDSNILQSRTTAVQLGLSNIVMIEIGNRINMALESNGSLWVWGADYSLGYLGDNATLLNRFTPVRVAGLTKIVAMNSGNGATMALKSDGSIYSWGSDYSYNMLADGLTAADQSTPVLTTAGICAASPLPIELLSFTGKNQGSTNELRWITATEINNDYFTIERSLDGVIFEPVGPNIDGAGNSTHLINYSLVDEDPYQRTYYRLKQTDFDYRFTYSNIIMLVKGNDNSFAFEVYPNPNKGSEINVLIAGKNSEEVLVVVSDVLGKESYSKVIISGESNNDVYAIDPSNKLSPGIYMITASSKDKTYSKRLIVQ